MPPRAQANERAAEDQQAGYALNGHIGRTEEGQDGYALNAHATRQEGGQEDGYALNSHVGRVEAGQDEGQEAEEGQEEEEGLGAEASFERELRLEMELRQQEMAEALEDEAGALDALPEAARPTAGARCALDAARVVRCWHAPPHAPGRAQRTCHCLPRARPAPHGLPPHQCWHNCWMCCHF